MNKMAIALMLLSVVVCFSSLAYLNKAEEHPTMEEFVMNLGIPALAQGNGEDLLEPEKISSDLIADNAGTSIVWAIEKSGAEENLDVSYTIINNTATEFCIEVGNREEYENALSSSARDINQVPIEKILLAKDFTIEKVELNLSKDEKSIEETERCFTVIHSEGIKEGMQFRIGWESVEITGDAQADATYDNGGDNFCIVNNVCHVAYKDTGADAAYANATYDPVTHLCSDWGYKDAYTGTVDEVGIVCMPNGYVYVYFTNGGDIDYVLSTDDGASFGSPQTLADTAETFDQISCEGSSDNVMHCCACPNSDIWYGSTATAFAEKSGTDSDACDIAVDSDDNVFIAIIDTISDDLTVMSSIDNWASRNVWMTGAIVTDGNGLGPSLGICTNGTIYSAHIDTSDLQFCTSDVNSWTSASCAELDSAGSTAPDIACSENGDPYILYDDSLTGSTYRANRTDGSSWEVRTLIDSNMVYPSIAQSVHPTQSNMDSVLNFVVTDDAGTALYYDYFEIQEAPEITYNLTITEPTTADPFMNVVSGQTLEIDFNFTKWIDGAFDSIVTSGLTMENVTVDGTDCKVNGSTLGGDGEITLQSTSENVADIQHANLGIYYWFGMQIKWDLSSIPSGSNIDNADLCLYVNTDTGPDDDVIYWRVDDQSWTEASNAATINGQSVDTQTSASFDSPLTANQWSCIDVTTIISTDFSLGNTYSTIRFEDVDAKITGTSTIDNIVDDTTAKFGSNAIYILFRTREHATTSTRPYLYVEYSSTSSTQFAYSPEKGIWEVNCSAPAKDDGTYDLFLNGTYGGTTYNNTQPSSVTYGAGAANCWESSPLTADCDIDCTANAEITGTLDCDGNSITTSNKGSGSIIFENNPVNCVGITLGCAYITQKG